MRRMQWSSALLALAVLTGSAFGADYNRYAAGNCASCERGSGYGAPACAGPAGYSLAPGCCECPPSACDNAWAGYCQEKARWQAFWARVGTGQWKYRSAACYTTDAPSPAGVTRLPPPATVPAPGNLQSIPEPKPLEPGKVEDKAYSPAEKPIPNETLRRWTLPR